MKSFILLQVYPFYLPWKNGQWVHHYERYFCPVFFSTFHYFLDQFRIYHNLEEKCSEMTKISFCLSSKLFPETFLPCLLISAHLYFNSDVLDCKNLMVLEMHSFINNQYITIANLSLTLIYQHNWDYPKSCWYQEQVQKILGGKTLKVAFWENI